MSQFFISGGQSIVVSASASVLPMNIQDSFPLGWTGWISLQSLLQDLSRDFSNSVVQNHQFFGTQLSLWSNSHIHTSEMKLLSHVLLFVTPWTVAHQAPLSKGFSRQEYSSGLPFPSPGDLPNAGMEAVSLTPAALPAQSLPLVPLGSTSVTCLQRSYFSCTLS